MLNRRQHRTQFFQTIGDVAALIAIPLACEDELAKFVDPAGELVAKTLLDAVGNARRFDHGPRQYSLGVYFVDILSAGAR